MEIEVGEYIRIISGDIYKYDETNQYILNCDLFYNRIVKHSKNIIDLIQCGDFVNGSLVISDTKNTRTETCDGEEHKCIIVSRSKDDVLGWKMIDFDIKDILTKEQYEQNSYKI